MRVAARPVISDAVEGNRTPAASIVVVSRNEGDHLQATIVALSSTVTSDVEIIVVDDLSTDGSTQFLADGHDRVRLVRPGRTLGVAGARNFGARAAGGQILVFGDAHVAPDAGWLPPLQRAIVDAGAAAAGPTIVPMRGNGAAGYGFTWREPTLTTAWLRRRPPDTAQVPMLCGCFMAVDRRLFADVGGFDDGLLTWGLEDAELAMRLWRRGHCCVVAPQSQIRHLFRPRFPYQVDWSTTLYNVLRLAVVHFRARALARVLERFSGNSALPGVYARIVDSDVWLRRDAVESASVHEADAFFEHFAIDALR